MSASEDPATDGAPSVRKTRDEIRAMSNAEFAESLRAAQAAGGPPAQGRPVKLTQARVYFNPPKR